MSRRGLERSCRCYAVLTCHLAERAEQLCIKGSPEKAVQFIQNNRKFYPNCDFKPLVDSLEDEYSEIEADE